jgi:hypothetical protein
MWQELAELPGCVYLWFDDVDFGVREATMWCTFAFHTTFPEDSMKYLCMIYDDEKKFDTMSKEQFDTILGEYGAFTKSIQVSGQYLGGNALQPTQTATTVRVRQGKISTTDGPFAETKEQLGGYYLVEAKDLNEAIQLGSRIPSARTGSIEIRPIIVYGTE